MVNPNLVVPREAMTDFCRRHHIRKLYSTRPLIKLFSSTFRHPVVVRQ